MEVGNKVLIYDAWIIDEPTGKETFFFGLFTRTKYKETFVTEYTGTVIGLPEGWKDHPDLVPVKVDQKYINRGVSYERRSFHRKQLKVIRR